MSESTWTKLGFSCLATCGHVAIPRDKGTGFVLVLASLIPDIELQVLEKFSYEPASVVDLKPLVVEYHNLCRGVADFENCDELYPTLIRSWSQGSVLAKLKLQDPPPPPPL